MAKLNEFIARKANTEDDCTGRFWEGRFTSQALLDESALFACMAYVDLNPIRAGICLTPEASDFTSIKERIFAFQQQQPVAQSLCTFQDEDISGRDFELSKNNILPMTRFEYFELVDLTGRLVRGNKSGAIPDELAPILNRLQINPETWLDTVNTLGECFAQFMGRSENIEERLMSLNKKRLCGLKSARRAFFSA